MANTVPLNLAFGLNVANNLIVDSTSLTTNGMSVNSTGVDMTGKILTVAGNLNSNNLIANTVTHLNLIANLVSQNVISGNLATLKQLIANEAFVNSISGNIATGFLNFTSNQFFVNSITGNNATFSDLVLTTLDSTSNLVFGNATNYTIMSPNGFYFADGNGVASHMPAEVLLQTGTVTGVTNFTVNFANEVNSNLFPSMKLVVKFYVG